MPSSRKDRRKRSNRLGGGITLLGMNKERLPIGTLQESIKRSPPGSSADSCIAFNSRRRMERISGAPSPPSSPPPQAESFSRPISPSKRRLTSGEHSPSKRAKSCSNDDNNNNCKDGFLRIEVSYSASQPQFELTLRPKPFRAASGSAKIHDNKKFSNTTPILENSLLVAIPNHRDSVAEETSSKIEPQLQISGRIQRQLATLTEDISSLQHCLEANKLTLDTTLREDLDLPERRDMNNNSNSNAINTTTLFGNTFKQYSQLATRILASYLPDKQVEPTLQRPYLPSSIQFYRFLSFLSSSALSVQGSTTRDCEAAMQCVKHQLIIDRLGTFACLSNQKVYQCMNSDVALAVKQHLISYFDKIFTFQVCALQRVVLPSYGPWLKLGSDSILNEEEGLIVGAYDQETWVQNNQAVWNELLECGRRMKEQASSEDVFKVYEKQMMC